MYVPSHLLLLFPRSMLIKHDRSTKRRVSITMYHHPASFILSSTLGLRRNIESTYCIAISHSACVRTCGVTMLNTPVSFIPHTSSLIIHGVVSNLSHVVKTGGRIHTSARTCRGNSPRATACLAPSELLYKCGINSLGASLLKPLAIQRPNPSDLFTPS